MVLLGLDPWLYALAVFLAVLVGSLRPVPYGETRRPLGLWALVVGGILYVVLVLVTLARGEPLKRA